MTTVPTVFLSPHDSSQDRSAGGNSPTPLTIVHVLLSLDVGGLERNVVNQVREAPRIGQHVHIICLERPGAMAPRIEALGGTVTCMNKQPGLRWGLFGKLAAVLRQIKPHVVHTHQLATLLYGGRAARMAGVPLIVHTEHGKENYDGRTRTRLLGRFAARYVSRFYCLTEDMAAAIRKNRIAPESKVAVISNGIDSTPFRTPYDVIALRHELAIPEGVPVIGTVGRLTEIKRQDVLLRGFALLRKRYPNAHLLLVGDGPLKSELETLAASLDIAENVHFAGYQSQTAPYYRLMSIFALTSRSEGMPQAAVEASFSGVPVVASRVGGLPELIDERRTGLLFKSGDEHELASALDEILRDPVKAAGFREAARERVMARYEIGRMADEYQEYYLDKLRMDPGTSRRHEGA